jgi:hypothetical protein
MNTQAEYKMAFRALRKWWKLVDEHYTPPTAEREHYKNICASYNKSILMGAMDSILARRKAEYFEQNPIHERAERRWKAQRWLEGQKPQESQVVPY